MKFKVYDKVRKIKGYKFEGIIIGAGYKLDGERILYMVEVEHKESYGWCGGCAVRKSLPIDRQCADCGELLEVVQFENNCSGMVHIFAEGDIELC